TFTTFDRGWHALSPAKGVISRVATPFAGLRACHPNCQTYFFALPKLSDVMPKALNSIAQGRPAHPGSMVIAKKCTPKAVPHVVAPPSGCGQRNAVREP